MRLVLVGLVLAGCGVTDAQSGGRPMPGGSGPDAPAPNPLCDASDAKAAFGTHAVCVCNDLDLGAGFWTKPLGDAPADVGVDGKTRVIGFYDIGGSLVTMGGMDGLGVLTSQKNVSTASDVIGVGKITVKGDMMIGGDVRGVGLLDVDGVLGVRDGSTLLGTQRYGSKGPYVAPSVPCGCGVPAVDVAARVAEHKAGGMQLSRGSAAGKSVLHLEGGKYWADSLDSLGVLELDVDAASSLAVDGSLDAIGLQKIVVKPGATLDLYLAGGLAAIGWSIIDDAAAPGAVRIFVGGERKLSIAAGAQRLNASIYAPSSVVALAGSTLLGGAIFAKTIGGLGKLIVDYTPPVAASREQCITPL